MKCFKLFGLATMASMTLMALVGVATASTTVLCKEAGKTEGCGASSYPTSTLIHVSLKAGTSEIFEEVGTSNVLGTCTTSTLEWEISKAGGATATVSGPNKVLTWGSATTACTHPTTTSALGELEIHWIAGTDNGTVTLKNTSWTIGGLFGVSCTYESGVAKDVGTLLGGNPATIRISTIIPGNDKNSFICPQEERWTAEYTATTADGAAADLWVSGS